MKYSLRQVQIFLSAAHYQSISKAAKELSMSQSAASEALKTLERQFDMQLFDRVGKTLRLNEFGKSIRPQAQALLDQARDLEAAMMRHSGVGGLKIGATLSIGNYLAINLLADFIDRHPHAKTTLHVANTTHIQRMIHNFELDVGLIEGEINDDELESILWREDELVVFCSPGHPLAKKGQLDNSDIETVPWIVREPGSGTRQAFDWAMHRHLSRLNIRLELQHTEAIKRAVEANLGIGCLSAVTLQEAFKRGSLVPLAIPGYSFERNFYLVLHKRKYRSTGIEQWIEQCMNFC
ncbi:MAG: LysR family transcriptional regulator [Reinekea sp.]